MKLFKRVWTLALLSLLVLSLLVSTACGKTPDNPEDPDASVPGVSDVSELPGGNEDESSDPVGDATDEDSTDETEDTTDDATDTTDESVDATEDDATTTTVEDKTTTTKGEGKTTTTKADTKTTTGKTTTGKTTTGKTTTGKTTGKTTTGKTTGKTTTGKTTTGKTTTGKTTTKNTTTVTTTKTTTTTVTTTSTRYRPGITTTSKSEAVVTVPSQNEVGRGYEFDPGDEWTLYWNDEFDAATLDTTKWEVGNGKEKDNSYHIPENVTVQGGNLVLSARRQSYKGRSYTTSNVTTARKFSFQYGRLEFRARLTYGQGVWPALWTMGDSYLTASSDETGWPVCGEIDVMEMIGRGSESEKYTQKANSITTHNLHWGPNRDEHYALSDRMFHDHRLKDGVVADSYHIYAIEWDENSIKFFFDDELLNEININDPTMGNAFHQPHWIIMNVSLCNWEPEWVDETTPFPQSMFVDYVRVYKKK
ncbi:MAG: glycoside hydrolase family 16 protein [Clostridia bacterium]|nr:glycoside hydrolase family 16 protein [Clostridia bacterium]